MMLSDLEKLWKQTDFNLEKSLQLNEALIVKIIKHAKDDFLNLVKLSELGRNLALLYSFISICVAIKVVPHFQYAILGFIRAIFMLLSFLYHLRPLRDIRKLKLDEMPILEIQLEIRKFRIRSLRVAKYDYLVVVVWFVTLIPMTLYTFFHFDLFNSLTSVSVYLLASFLIFVSLTPLNQKMYKNLYENKLIDAEGQIEEILKFQK